MKHTKLLVAVLLVALLACLAMTAMADGYWYVNDAKSQESTCNVKGWIWEDCYDKPKDSAGATIIDTRITYLDPKPHNWSTTYVVKKQPTCVTPGEEYLVCTNPGCTHVNTASMRTIQPTGVHTIKTTAGKAAKCTEYGYKDLDVCTVCGKVDPDGKGNTGAQIPAKGHDFDGAAWTVEQQANCNQVGKAYRVCKRDDCNAKDYNILPKSTEHIWAPNVPVEDSQWIPVQPAKPATCTVPGCKAIKMCPVCGAKVGGEAIPATGHNLNVPWTVEKVATCAAEGLAVRKCNNTDIYGVECGYVIEKLTTPKDSTHGDANKGKTSTRKLSDIYNWPESDDDVYAFILAKKERTCTTPACNPVFRCKICGQTLGGNANSSLPATGHNWEIKNPADDDVKPTCLKDGKIKYTCKNAGCGETKTITIPATGHYATWQPQAGSDPSKGYVVWELKCGNTNCDVASKILATQVVKNGEKAPSGVITTGKVAVDAAYTNNTKGTTDIPLNGKTATAKSTTTKTTTKSTASSSASTKAAAAPATTETKTVATVAAVVAAPAALAENQAQLVADKHLYVVKNVAGEEIVLTVNVVDGKITVEANLAEGESLVLYANAEAVEAPTAENTLVLTANEAVELPEAFANAILAVVKTESLPAAVAAK